MTNFWNDVEENFKKPEVFDFCVLCGRIILFGSFFVGFPLLGFGFEDFAQRTFDFIGLTSLAALIALFYHPTIRWLDRKLP